MHGKACFLWMRECGTQRRSKARNNQEAEGECGNPLDELSLPRKSCGELSPGAQNRAGATSQKRMVPRGQRGTPECGVCLSPQPVTWGSRALGGQAFLQLEFSIQQCVVDIFLYQYTCQVT